MLRLGEAYRAHSLRLGAPGASPLLHVVTAFIIYVGSRKQDSQEHHQILDSRAHLSPGHVPTTWEDQQRPLHGLHYRLCPLPLHRESSSGLWRVICPALYPLADPSCTWAGAWKGQDLGCGRPDKSPSQGTGVEGQRDLGHRGPPPQ